MDAGEVGLRPTVGFIDHAALWARPGRVPGVDGPHGNAGELRLVRGELAKLGERPTMQTVALCLSGLNPLADVAEVFHRNGKPGAFGSRNDLLGDAVVDVLAKAGLLPAEFLQAPLGGFGSPALQSAATTGELRSDPLDIGTGVAVAEAIEGEINDPEVNTKHPLDVDLLGVGHVADAGEIPLSPHQHKIDLALTESEQGALALAADEMDLLAPTEQPDAHRVLGGEPEDAVIVGLSRVLAEPAQALTSGLISISHLGNGAHCSLRGQTKARPHIGIGQLVQIELARFACRMRAFGQVIARRVAALQRLAQRLLLSARRLQLDVGNEFHASSIDAFEECFNQEPAPPPRPEGRGFRRGKS